ncbi:uncharacterized protein LOC132620152 [Lycium barbarum]|uniref:uncharacterized protein LOC132620152 n=1 Tax=Lycium barbarum TaxID=112863 RepID=UPI00293E5F53|nr:uncharacterized protein LOC132620152 [Lycium barbarum]
MKSQAATERLKFFITQYNLSFIALQEPFIKEDKIETYKNTLGMQDCFANSSNKIWIFWKAGFHWKIFYISIVYAKSRSTGREDLWRYMRIFASTIDQPWSVSGDFNCILNEEEKYGGRPYSLNKSIPFIDCLNDCGLSDMGFTGNAFTWCNERKEQEIIWKILDRVLANEKWDEDIGNTTIQHLPRLSSDHCPFSSDFVMKKKLSSDTLSFLISGLIIKISLILSSLIGKLILMGGCILETKAHLKWHLEGDENTKYFHNIVRGRRKHLQINKILDNDNWLEEEEDVAAAAVRPISLSNVSQKIISKVINDRLANIIPKIISPNQSGFVKGRAIGENVLLAQEIIHDIRKPNKGSNVAI